MTEHELQTAIIDAAHYLGWLVVHFRPAVTAHGWRTPVEGDAGFPDLVLARDGVVKFVELKSARGQVHWSQQDWARELGSFWRLVRPADLDAFLEELR